MKIAEDLGIKTISDNEDLSGDIYNIEENN
jgi:hypothetical protein